MGLYSVEVRDPQFYLLIRELKGMNIPFVQRVHAPKKTHVVTKRDGLFWDEVKIEFYIAYSDNDSVEGRPD